MQRPLMLAGNDPEEVLIDQWATDFLCILHVSLQMYYLQTYVCLQMTI